MEKKGQQKAKMQTTQSMEKEGPKVKWNNVVNRKRKAAKVKCNNAVNGERRAAKVHLTTQSMQKERHQSEMQHRRDQKEKGPES